MKSNPKLVLLTGPAAGEVANYLDDEETTARFDVRDYWDAPRRIVGELEEYEAIEHEIRSLPGGEAWLVGLVLPEHHFCSFGGGQEYCRFRNASPLAPRWACEYCRLKSSVPARLAILAPDPPALLVERVRAWGGSVWCCIDEVGVTDGRLCCIYSAAWHAAWHDEPGDADNWPEAVRAALGEERNDGEE